MTTNKGLFGERYANKRLVTRKGGRYAKPEPLQVCPNCSGIMREHFDGDPRDPFPNPRMFRKRCFRCEPKTEAEISQDAEIEASRPKQKSIYAMLQEIADNEKSNA